VEDQWPAPGGEQPAPEHPRQDRRREVRIALTGVVVVLLVWFAVANLQDVRIHFWVMTTSAPLIVVVAISGFLGVASAGLWSRVRRRRRSARPPG
jgi:uncharacterized integral membrane protein